MTYDVWHMVCLVSVSFLKYLQPYEMIFKKTGFAILLAFAFSTGSAFASVEEPPAQNVPEGGSTLVILALAVTGIAVLRSKFRR